jgi:hypothetical protein
VDIAEHEVLWGGANRINVELERGGVNSPQLLMFSKIDWQVLTILQQYAMASRAKSRRNKAQIATRSGA